MFGVLGAPAVKHVVVDLKRKPEIAPERVHAMEMHNKQVLATHKVAVSPEKIKGITKLKLPLFFNIMIGFSSL